MFDLAKTSSENQIKGKLALQDVNKGSFINEKFDAYEQERSENENKNLKFELNRTVSKTTVGIKELENKIGREEQYSRRNYILIHGIAENKEE